MRATLWSAVVAALLLHATAEAQQPAALAQQQEIQIQITKMLDAIDALEWKAVRGAFSDQVQIDYTSLFGGSPTTLPVDTLLADWQGLLPGFDATQHLIGPVYLARSDGQRATAHTQVRGYHYIADAAGGALWMAAGRYVFALQRSKESWTIAGITFQLAYQEGNLELPTVARRRVSSREGRAGKQ
jgi:hypothetical protein